MQQIKREEQHGMSVDAFEVERKVLYRAQLDVTIVFIAMILSIRSHGESLEISRQWIQQVSCSNNFNKICGARF